MVKLERIMHVDDDDDIRFIVQMMLESTEDCEVASCYSGKNALEQVAAFRPQMLLLDVMMPEMTGEETWKAICQIDGMKDIPAVFLTAKAERSTTEKLLNAGALSVMLKPFDAEELSTTIRQCWEELQTSNAHA